jgi:hypothetical protein
MNAICLGERLVAHIESVPRYKMKKNHIKKLYERGKKVPRYRSPVFTSRFDVVNYMERSEAKNDEH